MFEGHCIAAKTNNGKLMFSSKSVAYDSNKLTFIKNQEASGLLNNLGQKNYKWNSSITWYSLWKI